MRLPTWQHQRLDFVTFSAPVSPVTLRFGCGQLCFSAGNYVLNDDKPEVFLSFLMTASLGL
jgi:hypothetical protein